jgi:TRAP-type mannitol/chloroaromatic compound transport system substrate-binding protein
MNGMKRREFLKKASVATLAGGAALATGCAGGQNSGPEVRSSRTYEWKMTTTWTSNLPILQESARMMSQWIEEMSEGRMKITVYAGGELIPAFEGFEAVSQGTVEMCHGVSYYWAGKAPATQFFSSVPFGMNAQQMTAWLYSGGGLKLWEELYAPFNLIPMPVGNTGFQMGGWFRKEINSVADLKGLKMRIPGLGGNVIVKAGGSALVSPVGEIYTNLDRGMIDATEWIGPYHDYLMGFYQAAKYYYYPGWHEPGTVTELMINKSAFDGLPAYLQTIIRAAAARSTQWVLSEFDAKNNDYLHKLINEENVRLRKFPDEVLATLKKYSEEAIQEVVEADAYSKKVYESYTAFRETVTEWTDLGEKLYYSGAMG